MRFLLLGWLLSYLLMANMELYPKKECELFNNLKHTKNRGNEVLRLDRSYQMLKHHKGQYLLKVEYATPPQRWVDDDCLSLRPLRGTPIYEKMHKQKSVQKSHKAVQKAEQKQRVSQGGKRSGQNLLALSWHNAFCETHRYKKECKRGVENLLQRKYAESSFVLHGLWPQPRANTYCNVDSALKELDKQKRWRDLPSLALDEEVQSRLRRVMPGVASDLHKHEWVKHGTCYGTDANRYFQDAISLVEQVNNSALGQLFRKNIGRYLSLKEVRQAANKAFGRGAGERVVLQCKRGMITEMWLFLGGGSSDLASLLKGGKKSYSRCKGGRVDRAGFSKETAYRTGFGR